MGEHAAVFGRPALIAAVDRRLVVEIRSATRGVFLDLPDVGVSTATDWSDLLGYAQDSRNDWRAFESAPSAEAFRRLRGDDPAHVVKIALAETAHKLSEANPPPLSLHLRSELPIGGGFGSSAATAIAAVSAYLAFRNHSLPVAELQALSLEIERRQHGSPSGIDNAAVLFGGLIWAYRDAQNRLATETLASSCPLLADLRIFDTGEPRQSTGEVVAAVRGRYEAQPTVIGAHIDHMEQTTRALKDLLSRPRPASATLVTLIREFQSNLEALGVVPPAVANLVRQIEATGGAAKISGAGALEGPGAGSLLVYHPDPTAVDSWSFLAHLQRLDLHLGAPGVWTEQVDI